MISVLLPSRGRPDLLRSSLYSLRGRASKPDSFEIHVAFDADDPDTASAATFLANMHRTTRFGYAGLHHYFNLLADKAAGDWLYLWNDDAVMLTDGWDDIINERKPDTVLHTIIKTRFPVIPAAWVRHIGHLSLSRHCDTWWDELGKELRRHEGVPIQGAHTVPNDRTAAEREYDVNEYVKELRPLMRQDADKIRAIL